MDELDNKIISLLKQDASVSLTKIARQLGVPEPTVYFRVNRLKKNGTIKYTVSVHGQPEEKLRAAVLTPKTFLISEMTKRIPERIGEALSREPDVVFAARCEEDKILVVWRGTAFDPAKVEGVVRVNEKCVSILKPQ